MGWALCRVLKLVDDDCGQEKIEFADDMLVGHAGAKVYNGDVILTYAFSSVVLRILTAAHEVTLTRVIATSVRPAEIPVHVVKRYQHFGARFDLKHHVICASYSWTQAGRLV